MSFPTLRTPAGDVPSGQPFWNRQRRSAMPSHRYTDVHARVDVPLTDRRWPSRRIETPPLWVPVDLRDGNQALAEPMDPARKRRFFELMLAMGFKEIEVGYPSASKTDFDFVRLLAERDLVPDDVTVVVFTPARTDLIERTFAAVAGLRNVVVHMYTATAPTWRRVVLGRTRDELRAMVRAGGRDIARLAGDDPGVRFEFSPEVFILTEPDYVLDVCDMMTALWDASPDRPVIHNLPATVEVATPNVYADQIEYMHRHLARRESVILSVHPHNDRGTGVACAELAVLAGAQRVEGCLFGNGERTGNVDLVTLALNLHAQGVDPMIDFGDIDEIRRTVEHCNRIGVHERHPYGGDLVYTAFSGTHQDAIKKGMAHHRARAAELGVAESEAPWEVPYLPIDPADVGRSYQAVIRVNSQSGKGGIAYLLAERHGLEPPRRLQIDFARVVQEHADATGQEVDADRLWELFTAAYVTAPDRAPWSIDDTGGRPHAVHTADGRATRHPLPGPDPVPALLDVLAAAGHKLEVLDLAPAPNHIGGWVAYLEYRAGGGDTAWAVGLGASSSEAALNAVIAAANR